MQENVLCGSSPSSLYDQIVSNSSLDSVDFNPSLFSPYASSTVSAFYDSDSFLHNSLQTCSYSMSELGLLEKDLPYDNHDCHDLQSLPAISSHSGEAGEPLQRESSSISFPDQSNQSEQTVMSLLPSVPHSFTSAPSETSASAPKGAFDPRTTNAQFSEADPHAADFLQERLGDKKWKLFSARLAERRLSASKSRSNSEPLPGKAEVSATTIDFLVKVEVVKEVLRRFVPHPYNPLKYLIHAWPGSTTGTVILTRSTVLNLSGWSNTQFSYWARRSEAISVLGNYDVRLRAIGAALERRLHEDSTRDGSSVEIQGFRPIFTLSEPSSTDAEVSSLTITGKGLDAIIEEVKKRTGESQFLRGKHSSLDAYGARVNEPESVEVAPAAASFQATFHPVEFTHRTPSALQLRKDRRDSRTGVVSRARQSWDASYFSGLSVAFPDDLTDSGAAENASRSLDSPPTPVTFLPANSEIGPTRNSPRRRRLSLSTSPTMATKVRLPASNSWGEDSI